MADVSEWAGGLDLLFLAGKMDIVEHGARHLHKAYGDFEYAKNICEFFDSVPPESGQLPFRDNVANDVQVVAREHADSVVVLFCDRFHRLGIPLSAVHRWLGGLPASLIYLRDFRRLYFLAGVRSLGARESTLAALRHLIASLGARRVLCCGNSAGAFSALWYGLELQADAVLALAGPSNLSIEFNRHLRTRSPSAKLNEILLGECVDLRPIYAAADRRPSVLLVYGEDNWDDRLHAEHMSGVPGIALRPFAKFGGHNVVMEVIRRGHFERLLEWLVETEPNRRRAAL